MKENIIFLMFVIQGNLDHIGGTSSSISGGSFVQTQREHMQQKEKAKKDVQTSRKPSIFRKTECECFQNKRGTPGVNSAVQTRPTHALFLKA